MAAETGIPSVYLEHQLSHGRATKKTQGSLIDKLRHKITYNRSWSESIKSVCGSVTERKMQTEASEPESVRGCLDTLQKAMKVISQQTMKERLDLIARQLGLSTQIQDLKISLGTDVFHVDVIFGESGLVSSVKLVNQGDLVESPDLKDILRRGDFKEFIEHLQGLQSIYQVTDDEKLKSKAFLALQALEKDLNQLAQFQNSISGVANYIHKCPLGIMLPRLAGKPMKLIYFVSPYDLLDKKTLTAHPLTVEAITENFLGQSVTVCIEPVPESQPANKLQTMPLMNVSKTQDGKTLPSFSAKSNINSMMLPASFVLVLPQSIPISTQILQKITASTQLEIHKEAPKQGLRSLILESFSNGKVKDSRKLHVSLPDQQHTYFLDGLNGGSHDQQGVMVSRIPFTHPTHVPQILNLMRQQLLFNIIISSFIRTGKPKDSEKSVVFEVTAVSLQQMTIVFEHPAYDSMITEWGLEVPPNTPSLQHQEEPWIVSDSGSYFKTFSFSASPPKSTMKLAS
ncbi:mediator of RNA polymerase ii transcription subunit 1 [Plakobranchus ocellatus]|uniref:Mediator of RNA polymerase II transcription subunit 1 n=1 Tax=Plakobranchus ocellatus TaxID=259542 RepID=A0AAV4A4Q0_9GAST|nr:mediator of RNA polymerase ii transcription subunit 1 [Plakobranchus ocellatus]